MFVFSTTENILFQKLTKMAAVTFFGSSHACRHHWFPQHFLPLFEYSTRFVIEPEDIVGQSGRKMDDRAGKKTHKNQTAYDLFFDKQGK